MEKRRIEWLLHREVRKIVPYRKHWLVYTVDQKKWMVKRIKAEEHLRWWYAIDGELRSRGFQMMPSFYTDGIETIITPWIEGKIGNYRDLNQATVMVKQLAFFHRTGQRLQTPPKQEGAFLFFERLYHRLKEFYHLMNQVDRIPGKLGKLLVEVGPLFYADGHRVWRKLQQLPFQEAVLWERQNHRLAHRDLASHNWVIDQQRRIWLIDFDMAEYDSQLGDIWQMFTRIMAEHSLSHKLYQKLLTNYESIRPLHALEKKLLRVLIDFPNEFMREAIGLAKNKKGYSFASSFPYLNQLALQRINRRPIVSALGSFKRI